MLLLIGGGGILLLVGIAIGRFGIYTHQHVLSLFGFIMCALVIGNISLNFRRLYKQTGGVSRLRQ